MPFQKIPRAVKILALVVAPIMAAPSLSGEPQTSQQGTVFRATTNYVTTDVIVRGKDGRFIPDLKIDEFRVFEDGVPQKIATFAPSVGGRVLSNVASLPETTSPAMEGIVLPRTRPATDTSGRIFVIFIDDLHIQPLATPSVKQLLATIRDTLIHENDLVGFVSTGKSSIASDLAYDIGHRRFNEAINKFMGGALTPEEIITGGQTSEGPTQVRFMAHTAFQTAYGMLDQLARVTNRRKSFIYVSNGYDFNPFTDSRYKYEQERYSFLNGDSGDDSNGDGSGGGDSGGIDSFEESEYRRRTQFSFADLVSEVVQLVNAAKRANVAFYTIDPRGLTAGGEGLMMRRQMDYTEWRDYLNTQISALKVLAEETGGFAIVNTNDFKGGLQRIDNETSDYYIIGYYSTNPDPTIRRRRVVVEVTRPNVQQSRFETEYTMRRPTSR